MASKKDKELTTQEEGALAVMKGMTSFLGKGTEEATADDMAVPFLTVLQANSPVASPASPKFIRGAEAGMLMNTVTRNFYSADPGLLCIPCYFNKVILEWEKPYDDGGGFLGQHPWDEERLAKATRDEKNNLREESGHVLTDVRQHFCIMFDDMSGEYFQAVLSMASTNIKISRRWLSVINSQRVMIEGKKEIPPSFANYYRVKTIVQTDATNSWFIFDIGYEKPLDDAALFQEAVGFYHAISKGEVRTADPTVLQDG